MTTHVQYTAIAPELSLEDIGCEAYEDNPSFDCSDALNTYFADLGVGTFAPLRCFGKSYRITETVTIPRRVGVAIRGGGCTTDMRGDQEYADPTNATYAGGPATRFIWDGDTSSPMFHFFGAGMHIDGVSFQGLHAPTRAALVTATQTDFDDCALCGILVEGTTAPVVIGTGKITFGAVSFVALQTGIQFGSEFEQDNADTLVGHWFKAIHCGTAISLTGEQACNVVINHFDEYNCDVGLRSSGGGRVNIGTAIMNCNPAQHAPGILFTCAAIQRAHACWRVRSCQIDGLSNGSKVLVMDDDTEDCYLQLSLGLDLQPGISTVPLFIIRGMAEVIIESGYELIERMFEFHQKSGIAYVPRVIIKQGTTKDSVDRTKFVSTASDGTWLLKYQNVSEIGSGALYDGSYNTTS